MSKGTKQALFIALAAIAIVAVLYTLNTGRTASTLPLGQQGTQAGQQSPPQVDPALLQRMQELEKQVKAEPKDVAALTELGLLYFEAADLEKAANTFNAGLTVEPNNAELRVFLGLAYFWTGRAKEAMAEYQKAMKADPKLPDPYYQMALAQSHSQPADIPGAIENWQKVIELVPDSPIAKKSQEYIDKNKGGAALGGAAPPLSQSRP